MSQCTNDRIAGDASGGRLPALTGPFHSVNNDDNQFGFLSLVAARQRETRLTVAPQA